VNRKAEPAALTLLDDGEERILDKARLEKLGGVRGISDSVLASIAGE